MTGIASSSGRSFANGWTTSAIGRCDCSNNVSVAGTCVVFTLINLGLQLPIERCKRLDELKIGWRRVVGWKMYTLINYADLCSGQGNGTLWTGAIVLCSKHLLILFLDLNRTWNLVRIYTGFGLLGQWLRLRLMLGGSWLLHWGLYHRVPNSWYLRWTVDCSYWRPHSSHARSIGMEHSFCSMTFMPMPWSRSWQANRLERELVWIASRQIQVMIWICTLGEIDIASNWFCMVLAGDGRGRGRATAGVV